MTTSLRTLITKLNQTCRLATERAAGICMAHGNHEVDLEHLLLALCEQPASDLAVVVERAGIATAQLARDLEDRIRGFATGNTRTPVFATRLLSLLRQAWLVASLDTHRPRIRSGHLLLALLSEPDLAQFAQRGSALFARIRLDALKHEFDAHTAGSVEAHDAANPEGADAAPPADADADAPPHSAATPALQRYTTALTQRARDGLLDPVIGRDREIRQLIDILMRRRQNNPILTGEAGVGKTAVVEGLALRIAHGDVPPALAQVALHVLDMGLLQAGASVKGEFENRLRAVIDEVRASPRPIILFIDEAHTIIGAGGQAGQNDAANLLKPALARGELRTVAATTWAEYKKYFEKDAALARRFQVVKVDEPAAPVAADMLRAMVPLMERHFGVRVLDDAVTEAVRLSQRYITGRQLPDKAVSVLDTACARVALAHSATPAAIDALAKRLQCLHGEHRALQREACLHDRHRERLAALHADIGSAEAERQALAHRHARERQLVDRIVALRGALEQGPAPGTDPAATRAELDRLGDELAGVQGDAPMVPLQVDGQVVAEIVSAWTGVPLGKMLRDEMRTVLNLKALLQGRVLGQDHALEAIAQRIRTARANLEDPNKPKGVFLLAGPSGVGKTETAAALADILYGGEHKLVTINMSEYQEAHSVSGLKGSPPGYVGYGEGGALTEAVRRTPHCVVLLDEVDKAHPDVMELFFQVFDKGVLDDAEGQEVDFRHTLIVMTSNIGSAQIMHACLNKPDDQRPPADALAEVLRPALHQHFKPAFLGRLKVVPYYPISDDTLADIITLKLQRIGARIAAHHKAGFQWNGTLVDALLARCTEVDSGARNVDHILSGSVLPALADAVLEHLAEGRPFTRIKATANKRGELRYAIA